MTDRTEATKRAYKKRFDTLFVRFRRETKNQPSTTAAEIERFTDWLVALRPTLKPSTWRQYRAAVIYQLAIKPAATPQQLQRIERALSELQAAASEEEREARDNLPSRTSALKLRKFPVEDQKRIFNHLANMPSRNSEQLRVYLVAALATGLRPTEWQNVTIACAAPLTLYVRNAKHDEVRGNGEARTLIFRTLDVATRTALYAWMKHVQEAGENYPQFQGRLADALRAVTKAIWPRRSRNVTMYSARHEFAAVAKLALASEPDGAATLAALMGHASDITASNHYGRYGRGKALSVYIRDAVARLPSAKAEEIASVRRRLEEQRWFLDSSRDAMRLGP